MYKAVHDDRYDLTSVIILMQFDYYWSAIRPRYDHSTTHDVHFTAVVEWRSDCSRIEVISYVIDNVNHRIFKGYFLFSAALVRNKLHVRRNRRRRFTISSSSDMRWGTGIRGLMRGMTNLPKVTRSYLWSKTKLANPGSPGEWPLKLIERERERERVRQT